jgi:hypothetical protein
MVSSYSVFVLDQTISQFTLDRYVQVYLFCRQIKSVIYLYFDSYFLPISLTGARLERQSKQILIYYRYEIVMEYEKRPRLPPPFVVISYIGNEKFFSFYSDIILILIFVHCKAC